MSFFPSTREREWIALIRDLEELSRKFGIERTIDWPERPDPSGWLDPLLAEAEAAADHGGTQE